MKVIALVVCLLNISDAARILGLYGHPGRSHQILGEVILKELAKRGHEVTMISSFPLKTPTPNYRDIFLDGFLEDIEQDNGTMYLEMEKNPIGSLIGTFDLIHDFTNKTFAHPAVQNLISSREKFDLILMDWFCKDAELYYGHIFQAPIIVTASYGTSVLVNYLINNPAPNSYVPSNALTDEMTFTERLINYVGNVGVDAYLYYNREKQMAILRRYFENPPSFDEMRNNVALVFTNAHPSFESPRPYLPNVISIGGLHVQPANKLPLDLQRYLDGATQGVVYFSLGSHMKSAALPAEVLQEILSAFAEIPQLVLWKFEAESLPNKPENVIVRKWFPQNDIFNHPNVKAFITHGGLLSKIEAIFYGIPMVGIPFFGDQPTTVLHSVHENIAVRILYKDLNKVNLLSALNEVVNNTIYKKSIELKSRLLRDQQTKPLDSAIYWIGHVLRYNGTRHLQNQSVKLYWFENAMLDVAAFLVFLLIVIIVSVCKLIKLIYGMLNSSREIKIKQKSS